MIALLTFAALAAAQPAPDAAATPPADPSSDVVVTGRRAVMTPPQARAFVRDIASPPGETLSRLEPPVCVAVFGFAKDAESVLRARMEETARGVGAKVAKPGCEANIVLILSNDPDSLLTDIRRHRPEWLASLMPDDIRRLRKGPSKVRSWSFQLRRDGVHTLPLHSEQANIEATGSRFPVMLVDSVSILRESTKIDVEASFIIVPRAETTGATLAQVADYAMMRGLTPTREPVAETAPTILTLYTRGAAATPDELTYGDIVYLQTLFRSDPRKPGPWALNEIARNLSR